MPEIQLHNSISLLITWTTYGTWLPGDERGWTRRRTGAQQPQPLLADWCARNMSEDSVLLSTSQRRAVESVCRDHARIRGWTMHAVNARTNHVHLVVTADRKPQQVRDQFKANATRVLRQMENGVGGKKLWPKGGDCSPIDAEDGLARAIEYVLNGQDAK